MSDWKDKTDWQKTSTLRVHNLKVAQSREGWTTEDCQRAMRDAWKMVRWNTDGTKTSVRRDWI